MTGYLLSVSITIHRFPLQSFKQTSFRFLQSTKPFKRSAKRIASITYTIFYVANSFVLNPAGHLLYLHNC